MQLLHGDLGDVRWAKVFSFTRAAPIGYLEVDRWQTHMCEQEVGVEGLQDGGRVHQDT